MKIISIANQKGGVGKTTITFNLGYELSKSSNVLLIDMDSQCNLTSVLTSKDGPPSYTILDLLNGKVSIKQCISKSPAGISYIAGNEALNFYNDEDATKLKKALSKLRGFGYVLIDNPPNINNLTLNSFTASEHVLIVSDTEAFSQDGIPGLMENIDLIRATHNRNLKILGIAVNRMNDRRSLCKSSVRQLRRQYGDLVLSRVVNNYSEMALSTHHYHRPVGLQYPSSKSAMQLDLLTAEVKVRL